MNVVLLIFVLVLFSVGCWLYALTLFRSKLRVLMYHKLSTSNSDRLTVQTDVFEKQLLYLKKHYYNPISLSQLIDYKSSNVGLPKRPVLITFDDGYENNYVYLYPLLKKYGLKATIFLPVGFIGKSNCWDEGSEVIMCYDRLKEMNPEFIEYGLHSFGHINYSKITEDMLIQDIVDSKQKLLDNAIPFVPAIAYPYGAYPREKNKYARFVKILEENNILFGLRIGNRINKLPLSDPYCLKRIDIKGTDSFIIFKIKLLFGRVKLF